MKQQQQQQNDAKRYDTLLNIQGVKNYDIFTYSYPLSSLLTKTWSQSFFFYFVTLVS